MGCIPVHHSIPQDEQLCHQNDYLVIPPKSESFWFWRGNFGIGCSPPMARTRPRPVSIQRGGLQSSRTIGTMKETGSGWPVRRYGAICCWARPIEYSSSPEAYLPPRPRSQPAADRSPSERASGYSAPERPGPRSSLPPVAEIHQQVSVPEELSVQDPTPISPTRAAHGRRTRAGPGTWAAGEAAAPPQA